SASTAEGNSPNSENSTVSRRNPMPPSLIPSNPPRSSCPHHNARKVPCTLHPLDLPAPIITPGRCQAPCIPPSPQGARHPLSLRARKVPGIFHSLHPQSPRCLAPSCRGTVLSLVSVSAAALNASMRGLKILM